MFNIDPKVKLMKISPQFAYCDEKSKEAHTEVLKRKYKVAGNVINSLGIYTFFVLTSKIESCQKFLTVCIEECHWENRNYRYLHGNSYLDVKKIESLSKDDLIEKIDDPGNKFVLVAKLCDQKYDELREMIGKLQRSSSFISEDTKKLIAYALSDDISGVLAKLGLN